MEFERKFFVFLNQIFRRGCQNWNLCASEVFFTKQTILKKYILSQSLSVFRRQFSRFGSRNFSQIYQFCIQFVWRNISRESIAGNKLFFIAFFKIFTLFTFLWIYAYFYWQCCQNWTLHFHRIVFTGSLFMEKKFQIVFQFVGQSFSGLWQNVFCTVVRTAFFVSSGTLHGEKFSQKPRFFTWGSSVKLSRNLK